MARVKKGVTAHARHKKILKLAKGYRGTRSRLFKKANETVMKALYYARRDRLLINYIKPKFTYRCLCKHFSTKP